MRHQLATAAVDPVEFFGAASIAECLARSARDGHHGLSFVDAGLNEEFVSYKDLEAAARCSAWQIRRYGIQPGDRVALLSSTTADLVRVLFGVWYAGAVPVLLPAPRRRGDDLFRQDMRRRIAVTGARLVLEARVLQGELTGLAVPTATVEDVVAGSRSLDGPPPDDPGALAILQFTSGTTASSRAVMVTHQQMLANMAGVWSTYGVNPDVVGISWLPLNHDMGIVSLIGGVACGNHGVVQAPEHFVANPLTWVGAITKYRASMIIAPNFAYALTGRLLQRTSRPYDLSSVRWAFNGAEPIDIQTLNRFVAEGRRFGLPVNTVCPMYGMAEATLCATLSRPGSPLMTHWVERDPLEQTGSVRLVEPGDEAGRPLVACGYALPGTQVRVHDSAGRTVPPWQVGEIVIAGPCVTRGYWNDHEETAAILRDGWLHTGDLGYLSDDGLVVCGRQKDMIILNGRNLYPEDFELAAEQVVGVRSGNSVAFGLPNSERMVLVAEASSTRHDLDQLAGSIMEHLRQRLPTIPADLVICRPASLPKTTSGKRQRTRCRQMYLDGALDVIWSSRGSTAKME